MIISDRTAKDGLYDGESGMISCAVFDMYLAIVSADGLSVEITIYGSDNEITDIMTVNTGGRQTYNISVADYEGEPGAVIRTGLRTEHFRLVNDKLTLTSELPSDEYPAVSYKKGKLAVLADPYDIYDVKNFIKHDKALLLRPADADLSDAEKHEILTLLKASADIMRYDSNAPDTDTLTRHVLFTHRNFELLSDIDPESGAIGNNIRSCSAAFIEDVMHKAFRINPPAPAVNMLTELGFCRNNGKYHYTGGYTTYFATDVKELVRTVPMPDGTVFAVFYDTYTEGGAPIPEYSTAVIARDSEGYYIKSLDMDGDIILPKTDTASSAAAEEPAVYPLAAAALSALAAVSAVGVLIWRKLLR